MRAATLTVLVLALASPAHALAAEPQTLVQRIGAYGREVSRVEQAAGPVSLQPLLERGNQLAAELIPVLEALPAGDYQQVVRDMKGFVVERDEVLLAEPDARHFARLARRVGTDQDRAYFEFLLKIAPGGYWSVYIVRQTDAGGCTDYGSGTLSRLYAEGTAAAPRVGPYYRREVEKRLEAIARQLTAGTCACGDRQSVVKELRTFLQRNPAAAPAAEIKARLGALERGEGTVESGCVGGG